ncbi:hypothetical protein Esti_005618 [Eimeria stiedai]
MKKGDSFESLRWRALEGSRVAELLKQPEEARYRTLQAGGVGKDALKASPAGMRTHWKDEDMRASLRHHAHSLSAQVAARLCGYNAGPDPFPSAAKQENFRRRNSSLKVYEAFQKKGLGKQHAPPEQYISNGSTYVGNVALCMHHGSCLRQKQSSVHPFVLLCSADTRASEALNVLGTQGLLVDSAKLRLASFMKRQVGSSSGDHVGELLEHRFIHAGSSGVEAGRRLFGGKARGLQVRESHDMRGIIHHSYIHDDPLEPAKHRSCHSQSLENPCRWGVDVLNYQLPEPRKLKGKTVENLGPGLIPTHSFDEKTPGVHDVHSLYRESARGHLEPSTLYPLESTSLKFTRGKRRSHKDADGLDKTCTPLRDQNFRGVRRTAASLSQSHLQSGCVPAVDFKATRRRCNQMRGEGSLQAREKQLGIRRTGGFCDSSGCQKPQGLSGDDVFEC